MKTQKVDHKVDYKEIARRAVERCFQRETSNGLTSKKLIELKDDNRDWMPMAMLIHNAGCHFIEICKEELGEEPDIVIGESPQFFTTRTIKVPIFTALMIDALATFMDEDNVEQLVGRAMCEGFEALGTGNNPLAALLSRLSGEE